MIDSILLLTLFFSLLYGLFLIWCLIHWRRLLRRKKISAKKFPSASILIAARNEGLNLESCILSIAIQKFEGDFPEIIIVDDHSSDNTTAIAEQLMKEFPALPLKIIRLPDHVSGSKKEAIAWGVKHASSDWILVTDADCRPAAGWLKSMLSTAADGNTEFIAGPVRYAYSSTSFLQQVQALELMGLVGIAAAGISSGRPIMCNGANMAFSRKAFLEVNGFGGKNSFVSGDDTQLLLKITARNKNAVAFNINREAIVNTDSLQEAASLWEQRKRWAGKIPFTLSAFTVSVAVLAWCTHAALLAGISLFMSGKAGMTLLLPALLVKLITEFMLLINLSDFYKERKLLWLFLPAQIVYLPYIVLIGITAPFLTFRWKGRLTK